MKGSYRDLQVWQKGMDLAAEIYSLCKLLPSSEQFGLCSQMQRSAVSIPSNIAEGHGRGSPNEQLHFLNIANGSRTELQTQLLLCERIGYLTRAQTARGLMITEELGKMIYSFSVTLKKKMKVGK